MPAEGAEPPAALLVHLHELPARAVLGQHPPAAEGRFGRAISACWCPKGPSSTHREVTLATFLNTRRLLGSVMMLYASSTEIPTLVRAWTMHSIPSG